MRMVVGGIVISKTSKIEDKLRQIPTPNDITYVDFVGFLKKNGFTKRQSGSHESFYYQVGLIFEIVVFKKPHGSKDGVEEPYIRKALEAVDRIRFENLG